MKRRQKVNLATSITTNYAGELARPYIAAAILSGRTLADRSVNVMENVKYKANLNKVASSGLISAGACDFSDGSTITLTERVLTPTELMVNIELCKKDWIPHWESLNMGAGRLGQDIPATFSNFLLEHVAAKVGEEIEHHIWNGEVGGSTGYARFDGFIEIQEDVGLASPNNQSSASLNPASFAATNDVTDVLETFLGLIPSKNLDAADFCIYMNRRQILAYATRMGTLGYKDEFFSNEKPMDYLGFPIKYAPGLPDTHIFAGTPEDFVVGTDLLSDLNEANVIDMAQTDGSQNVRIVMRFAVGCQLAVTEDVFMFKYTG